MSQEVVNLIGMISLWTGVIALILAFVQSWQSVKQTKRLQKQSDSLTLITDSLSTRYIGQFPDYLVTVTAIIESAKTELRIVKGNPTPAYFSAPELWISYSQAIERKSRAGVMVSIISMSERQRRIRLAQQFPTTADRWSSWVSENQVKVTEFLKFTPSRPKIEELDHNKFLDLLLVAQSRMLSEAFRNKGVDVSELDQVMPVQVWIADRKQAVFSIQTLPTNAISHGFYTSDPRIVSALHLMTELFSDQQTNPMNTPTRFDKIVVTKDLDRSIAFYRDTLGLEMRPLSNPVAIFKYDTISIYVYFADFFKQQFGVDANEVKGNGMLSIELANQQEVDLLKSRLTASPESFTTIRDLRSRVVLRDFNDLVIELWIKEALQSIGSGTS